MKSLGFSLIELMIAVAVLIVIAGMGTSAYVHQLARGRDQQRVADLARIQSALEKFRADNGFYPSELGRCETSRGICNNECPCAVNPLGTNWSNPSANSDIWPRLVNGGYLDALPIDPINQGGSYYYYEAVCAGDSDTSCSRSVTCRYTCCAYKVGAFLERDNAWTEQCSP